MGPVLEYVLNLHLREQVRSDVIGHAEIASGRLPGAQEITACFANMVGFTKLGKSFLPEELGAITGRLGELASDVAEPPVRLVKMIGDAAMLVSPDNDTLLDAALNLITRSEAGGGGVPAAACRRREGTRPGPRRRLVRASRQPGEPHHRDRLSGQRPGERGGQAGGLEQPSLVVRRRAPPQGDRRPGEAPPRPRGGG